jgi:hypothetical protein
MLVGVRLGEIRGAVGRAVVNDDQLPGVDRERGGETRYKMAQ